MQLSVECIDLGHEESASMLDQPVDDARAWVAADVDKADCVVMLDDAARGELLQMAETMRADPLPVLLRDPEQFAILALRDFLARARELLDRRPGIAVIDRLPLDWTLPSSWSWTRGCCDPTIGTNAKKA